MKVPASYYDTVFQFRGRWDMPSCCGLKILRREAAATVIVTELYQDNPGTSVTEAGKSLAEQICAAEGLHLDAIRYIECSPATDSKLSFYDEELFEVDFAGGEPAYRRLSAAEARALR